MLTTNTVPSRGRSGFTLIELMVSVAILALLVVVLASIFGGVSQTWQMGQSNSERLQNIRVITGFISGELRAALLPVNRSDKGSLQFIVNPTDISPTFRNPDAIFWQAPVAANQELTDVAQVGYFVKWDMTMPDNPRPILCRMNVSKTIGGSNFLIYSQAGGTVPWLSDSLLNAVAPGDKANAYEGLVAENVVALFIESRDAKGKPITNSYAGGVFLKTDSGFDSRQGFTDASGVKSADFTDAGGTKAPLCVLPPIVKLSFVLIDSRSVNKIGVAEKNALTGLANTIAQRSPKGDASDFVTAALGMPALNAISGSLRAYQTEINLLNAQ